ncbi:hypothetical protein ACVIW2_006820 [Bradyrhizobium huanghuaihaiense]|uniref:Uncharacterized protein DUF3616 n=1 Tax=Bradyrhizobium huanghuaihaiense TaxID=990078 RepID=A0A562RDM8_9BRAD|nr:DUF3616 domain-containing protein [Bradyrhizobium huanghuaihaiense]TWI67162.1 uncharacterized protein DUF3616 [Bradyrhizobium huanghuaihaiense]
MTIARTGWIAALLLGLVAAGIAEPGRGAADDAWPVKNKLLGKDGDKSEDVSGIACTKPDGFPRSCLVIDDNIQDAQFVQLTDGKLIAGSSVNLIKNTFKDKALELDGEGVAFSNGFYYVIGSHGHPRDKDHKLNPTTDAAKIQAKIAASSQIVRFRTTGEDGNASDVQPTPRLRDIIASEPALLPFMDLRLETNGLTIEGVAIKDDRTLLAGFRGPVLNGNCALVLSVEVATLFGNGKSSDHRLHRLSLGDGRGVRDLAPFGERILVLAGPVADGPGAYAVFAWDGASDSVELLKELPFDPKRKPEGLLPLDKTSTGLRVLIVFDGDKEGAPTPIEIPGSGPRSSSCPAG